MRVTAFSAQREAGTHRAAPRARTSGAARTVSGAGSPPALVAARIGASASVASSSRSQACRCMRVAYRADALAVLGARRTQSSSDLFPALTCGMICQRRYGLPQLCGLRAQASSGRAVTQHKHRALRDAPPLQSPPASRRAGCGHRRSHPAHAAGRIGSSPAREACVLRRRLPCAPSMPGQLISATARDTTQTRRAYVICKISPVPTRNGPPYEAKTTQNQGLRGSKAGRKGSRAP